MPFLMIRNDIAKVEADAIVNPANVDLLEGSGSSRAIFLSAGERKLEKACRKIKKCKVGNAVLTDAFDLPAKYIIHAAGPVWQDGKQGEEKILYRTYKSALELAVRKKCRSVAFPLLSSGNYGFPKDRAMKTAVSAFRDFLSDHDLLIYLVLYDKNSFSVGQELFAEIEEYIDDHYVEEKDESFPERRRRSESVPDKNSGKMPVPYCTDEIQDAVSATSQLPAEAVRGVIRKEEAVPMASAFPMAMPQKTEKSSKRSLDDLIKNLDETFSQMLLRLIDERGLKDSVVYKKANIDRRHFSKIRNNINYLPTKRTVFSFAIALELSLDETRDLMKKAGYAISGSSRFDVIVSYFLENGIYDIFEINEVLFAYEEPILGT